VYVRVNAYLTIKKQNMKKMHLRTSLLITISLFTAVSTFASTNTWSGATSTHWMTATNWTLGAVPTSSDDVIIPSGASRYPVILLGMSVSAKALNISGGNVTIYNGGSLSIYGDLVTTAPNQILGDGDLSLVGDFSSIGNTISGYGFSCMSIYIPATTYTVSAILNGTIDIRSVIVLSGSLTTHGKVVLKSTATATAYMASDGGWVTDNITMERYVSGIGWHHLSSAVDANVSEWANDYSITGTHGVKSALNGTSQGTLQEYREAANTGSTLNTGYYNYTSSTAALTAGKGFTAKITTATRLLTANGFPRNIDYTVPITRTTGSNTPRGWNFVGNPYPAPISWNSVVTGGNAGSPMNGTCYIWKPTGSATSAGVWQAYNGTGVGAHNVGDIISSCQGFFVYTPSTTSLNLSFDNTRAKDDAVYYKKAALENEIRIRMHAINSPADEYLEAVTYTHGDALASYDVHDALLPPFAPTEDGQMASIAFHNQGDDYMIQTTHTITDDTRMPIHIHTLQAGVYELSATALHLSSVAQAYLYDSETGVYHNLATDKPIIHLAAAASNDRFTLVFNTTSPAVASDIHIYHTHTRGIVIERPYSETSAVVTITNLLGQELMHQSIVGTHIELPLSDEGMSMYIVKVKESDGRTATQQILVK
jgi:trimeric autotransporter adhesin